MKIYNELESLGFFEWLSETHNLKDTDMESEYLDKLPLNDMHITVCNSMAFRWFREKHEIDSHIEKYLSSEDAIEYFFMANDEESINFETYEEAESACIDKLIEIIKKK